MIVTASVLIEEFGGPAISVIRKEFGRYSQSTIDFTSDEECMKIWDDWISLQDQSAVKYKMARFSDGILYVGNVDQISDVRLYLNRNYAKINIGCDDDTEVNIFTNDVVDAQRFISELTTKVVQPLAADVSLEPIVIPGNPDKTQGTTSVGVDSIGSSVVMNATIAGPASGG